MKTTNPGRVYLEGGIYQGRGVGWPLGIDSFSHPLFVHELKLRWLENAVTQGGFVQPRPGYKTRLTWNTEFDQVRAAPWWVAHEGPVVHPQMLKRFRPSSGPEQLVFAISGSVFYTVINPDGSLMPPVQITAFQFNPLADQLVGCACTQSATIAGGTYTNNITPRSLLIIQDGTSRAGLWDGLTGVHANPEKRITVDGDGGTLYPESWNQTRIGLWMAFSGNRLFISNGRNVYASDLNDPTHFTEELKLQSAPVFTFEDEVTGLVNRGTSGTARSQCVVFTADTTETLWSGIQARLPDASLGAKGWAFTDDFRAKIFDGVGCVAGKSVIVHRGLLYWKARGGVVMFDGAATENSSQNLPPIDQEMAYSNLRITPSAEGADITCAGKFNNYVWWSVPVGEVFNGRRYCSQTQVLNRQTTTVGSTGERGAFSAGTTGWQGVWTGIKPTEWANANAGGVERTYAISMDGPRVVRIWEAFQSNRADNGHRIPWFMETRAHPVQPSIFEYASFKHFQLLLDQIYGNLGLVGMWRGLKGTYHEQLTTTITATPGSIFLPLPQFTPVTNTTEHRSFGLQGRTIKSRNILGPQNDCNSRGVESPFSDSQDHAFSLALRFVGRGGVSGYLIAADSLPENSEGTALEPTGISESGFNMVPQGGCPEHVDGDSPDYRAHDQPQQIGFCPYQPTASLNLEYTAPPDDPVIVAPPDEPEPDVVTPPAPGDGGGVPPVPPVPTPLAPVINSSLTASGTEGVAFSYSITAANTPTSFSASGLPAGLSINTGTGVISGTPTEDGSFDVTIVATNAIGSDSETLVITLAAEVVLPPVINSPLTADAVEGDSFSYTITATNSPTSFSASGLPAGLSVNTGTGAITGTPTEDGTFNVTIGATNAGGSDSETLVIEVEAEVLAPVITSSLTADAVEGDAFSYSIVATNSPTSYSASGLPAGLSVNTGSGVISGTPTESGSFNVTIGASNVAGSDSETLVITVEAEAVEVWFDRELPENTDSFGNSNPAATQWSKITLEAGSSFGARIYLGDNSGPADLKMALYNPDLTGPIAQGTLAGAGADNGYAVVDWDADVDVDDGDYFVGWSASTADLSFAYKAEAPQNAHEHGISYASFPPTNLPNPATFDLNRQYAVSVGVLVGAPPGGATHTAAAATRAAVEDAYDLCEDGDTLVLPDGTYTDWTTTLTVTKAITIKGENSADLTLIEDNMSAALPLFDVTLVADKTTRMTAMGFVVGSRADVSSGAKVAEVHGSNADNRRFRMDHSKFTDLYIGALRLDTVLGVFDNNELFTRQGHNAIAHVKHSTWDGGSEGNESIVHGADFGSENFFFFEYNQITGDASAFLNSLIDAQAGARYVFRHNVVFAGYIEGHGSEASYERSTAAVESYGNSFDADNRAQSVMFFRGAVGLVYDNEISNTQGQTRPFALINYRMADALFAPFGGADGRNPWDDNDSGNPIETGTVNSAGSLTLTVSPSPGWGSNVWTGHTVRKTSGKVSTVSRSGSTITVTTTGHGWTGTQRIALYGADQQEYNRTYAATIVDANTWTADIGESLPTTPATGTILACLGGFFSEIVSNTADTLTFKASIFGHDLVFAAADTFEINLVLNAMDQPGRTGGSLVSAAVTPTVPIGWNDQDLEPWYEWNNGSAGAGGNVAVAGFNNVSKRIVSGTHFHDGTPAPGYTAYGAHPLNPGGTP